jgi:hypothetical protein
MGFLPLAAITVDVVLAPPEAGRWLAFIPALMAAAYVPAMWASVAPTKRRRAILRGSVIASLVMAGGGAVLFGVLGLLVLAPATALLWMASGGAERGR